VHILDHKDWDDVKFIKLLRDKYGAKVKVDHPLKNYSTFKTGGPARIFFEITKADELADLIIFINDFNVFKNTAGG